VDLRFLSPLFLIGLAAAAVPIAIHLFRRQAEPVVPFGTVRFLRRVPIEHARRRRLREWLLLALRTLALVLFALSFARPYLADTRAAQTGPVTVIAVDTSYSVSSARQVQRARALARQAITDARPDRALALVAFDERASVVVAPTMDRGIVRAALDRVTPGHRRTAYAAAMTAAADVMAGRGGHVVVVSDLLQNGWADASTAALPAGIEVEALDVGPPPGNLGVVSLRRQGGGMAATVRNGGTQERESRVTLAVERGVRAEQQVRIPAGTSREVPFTVPLPAEGAVRVEVTDPEGYAADNVRFAALDTPPRPRIVAITSAGAAGGDSFYVERAFAAAEGPDGMRLDRITMDSVSATPAALEGAAGILLFSTSGLDRRASDAISRAVEAGAGLLLVPGPSLDPTRASPALPAVLGERATAIDASVDALTFAPTDVRHPVFAAFGTERGLLGSARFRRTVRWSASETRRTLARFSNGAPALVEVTGAGGHVLLLASDLANAWNDFALHPAFVPFVHDLVRYLAAGRRAGTEYRVGEWTGAGGDRPGVITTGSGRGDTGRRIAVNVDPREGEGPRLTPAAFAAAVPRGADSGREPVDASQRTREGDQSLWRYGLMVMLLGLAAESLIGRRA
jgi:Aerotolerance regulator N-terminal/von Willebrand factor type A domain